MREAIQEDEVMSRFVEGNNGNSYSKMIMIYHIDSLSLNASNKS